MKEILVTFASIVAVLSGAILIYANVANGFFGFEGTLGTCIGIILLAAGVTGLWTKRRLIS